MSKKQFPQEEKSILLARRFKMSGKCFKSYKYNKTFLKNVIKLIIFTFVRGFIVEDEKEHNIICIAKQNTLSYLDSNIMIVPHSNFNTEISSIPITVDYILDLSCGVHGFLNY